MGVIKVSLFQKSLEEGLNLSILKKLSSLKSDFLILPEYFYIDSKTKNFKNLKDKHQFTSDWLCKLNESYGGVVLTGSILREMKGVCNISTPVLADGQIVDWYNKRSLNVEEQAVAEPGTELSTFILGGQRFAVLLGDEIYNDQYASQLEEEAIKLVFVFSMIAERDQKSDADIAADEAKMAAVSKKHGLHIVRCCPVGNFMGDTMKGRSLVVNPTGVSWRISRQEEDKELIKTVMINVTTL